MLKILRAFHLVNLTHFSHTIYLHFTTLPTETVFKKKKKISERFDFTKRILAIWTSTLNAYLPPAPLSPQGSETTNTDLWVSGLGIISNRATFGPDGARGLRLGEGGSDWRQRLVLITG